MKRFFRFVPVALLAVSLYSTGCTAGSTVSAASAVSTKSPLTRRPDSTTIETFANHAELAFPNYGEDDKSLVSDRILDGFEAGPGMFLLADGTIIRWGFKYKEGTIKSAAISDKEGRVKLVAAVDDVPTLTSSYEPPIGSITQYNAALKHSGLEPLVNVFVRHEDDLKTYLPLLKRWLQAKLMGFNSDCSKPELVSACKLAEKIAIPTRAYVIAADSSVHRIAVPDKNAAPVPIKSFVQ